MIENLFSKPELFWFITGLGLFLLELLIPGFFIFFFGLGAWITALVCLIGDPGINLQIIIFAITSILALAFLRRLIRKKFFYSREENPVDVDDEFTGKEAVAINDFGGEAIGKVEFKGTNWQAESASPVKSGQRLIILKKENFKLFVEPKK